MYGTKATNDFHSILHVKYLAINIGGHHVQNIKAVLNLNNIETRPLFRELKASHTAYMTNKYTSTGSNSLF